MIEAFNLEYWIQVFIPVNDTRAIDGGFPQQELVALCVLRHLRRRAPFAHFTDHGAIKEHIHQHALIFVQRKVKLPRQGIWIVGRGNHLISKHRHHDLISRDLRQGLGIELVGLFDQRSGFADHAPFDGDGITRQDIAR